MFDYIIDLWIMNKGGLVVFKRLQSNTVDHDLFGGLMNAISAFAEEVAHSSVNSIKLQNMKYFIHKEHKFMFVANAKDDEKDKRAIKELQKVADLFFAEYAAEDLENWTGNVEFFSDFGRKIEENIFAPIKKLQDMLW